MKKLLYLFVIVAFAVVPVSARNLRKQTVVDSMTVRIVKSPIVWEALKSLVPDFNKLTADQKLKIEYVLFRLYSDAFHEGLSGVSDEILRESLKTMDLPLIRFFYSKEFYTEFFTVLSDALRYELEGKQGFSYALKSEGAAELVDVIKMAMKPMLDTYTAKFKENLPKAMENEEAQLLMSQAVSRIIRRMPELMVKTLSEYFDCRELLRTFSETGFRQGLTYGVNRAMENVMKSESDASSSVDPTAGIDEMLKNMTMDELSRYVELSRSMKPVHFSRYRPSIEIKEKKYEYSGEGRYGLPYGKGCMTDKKGIIYKGDFKNGRRHGLIEVTKPGEEPVLQVWADDRFMKKLRVGPAGDENVPEAATYLDMLFGYGYASGPDKTLMEGFFVDGVLHGKGKLFSGKYTMTGDFEHGVFKSGIMSYSYPGWKEYELRGRKYGDDFVGYRKKVSSDGLYEETATGVFTGDVLDGKHTLRIVSTEGTYVKDGFFAYGDMYGYGKVSRDWVDGGTRAAIRNAYEGQLAENHAHGEGTAEVTMTKAPKWEWMIKIYGVNVDELPKGKDATILMKGRFEYGKFVEGRVEVSNGIVMTGTFRDGTLYDGTFLRNCPDSTFYEIRCISGKLQKKGLIHLADGTSHEADFENGRPVVKKVAPAPPVDKIRHVDHSADQNTIRQFDYNDMPVKKGVVRVIRPAGVKIMVRGVSSLSVTCSGTFDGENLVKGKVTMSDGNWLSGTFEDGVLIKGRGKTVDKYGTVYVGDIKNGFPHGNGKCTYANGTWFKGKFHNGSRMQGVYYSADGKVIKEYK